MIHNKHPAMSVSERRECGESWGQKPSPSASGKMNALRNGRHRGGGDTHAPAASPLPAKGRFFAIRGPKAGSGTAPASFSSSAASERVGEKGWRVAQLKEKSYNCVCAFSRQKPYHIKRGSIIAAPRWMGRGGRAKDAHQRQQRASDDEQHLLQ